MSDADAFLEELDRVLPPSQKAVEVLPPPVKATEISDNTIPAAEPVNTDDVLLQLKETADSFKTLNAMVDDYTQEKKDLKELKDGVKETQFNHLNKKIQRLDRKNKRIVNKLKDLEKPPPPEEKKIVTHERRQIQQPGINSVQMTEVLENGTRKDIVLPKPPPPQEPKPPRTGVVSRLKKLIKPKKYVPPPVKANVPVETIFKGRTYSRKSIRI